MEDRKSEPPTRLPAQIITDCRDPGRRGDGGEGRRRAFLTPCAGGAAVGRFGGGIRVGGDRRRGARKCGTRAPFWGRNEVHTPWAGAGHYAIFMQQAMAPWPSAGTTSTSSPTSRAASASRASATRSCLAGTSGRAMWARPAGSAVALRRAATRRACRGPIPTASAGVRRGCARRASGRHGARG